MGLLCNLSLNYDRTIWPVVVAPPPPPRPPPTPQLQPLLPPSSSQVYPVKHMSYSPSHTPLEAAGTSRERKGIPSLEVPVSLPTTRPHCNRDTSPTDALRGSCECMRFQTSAVNTTMPNLEELSASDRRLHGELTVRRKHDTTEKGRMGSGPNPRPWGTSFNARKSVPRRSWWPASCTTSPSGLSLLITMVLFLLLAGVAEGSEFPDRECCDSVPPPPPHYHQATSTTTTTTPTPLSGHNASIITVSQGAVGVINCIQAREQCNNDVACRDVLNMLHKICGPELVACATVTPGKCRALLQTLDNFEYLRTCSCGEPHMDYVCYTFRETVFNHPCSRAVIAVDEIQEFLPTCIAAEQQCRKQNWCLKNLVEFINVCTFTGITCTSKEMNRCNESWRKVRTSPVFGCTCSSQPAPPRTLAYSQHSPYDRSLLVSEHEEERNCMVSYNRTHQNPCLGGQKNMQRVDLVEASQAMCHIALENCVKDDQCRTQLDKIMLWCEHAHCEPDRCRNALQEFYQLVSVMRRLQVAFCVCRQSDPDGECLTAMRKLHPTCAERHSGRDPMKCHKIAEQCRQNRVCGSKLQEYEKWCAADAMTGRCSFTHRNCQQAVMNILGTELHATCVCKGTDFLHQHDCYTWQKLLWSNPCVIESHLQLHGELSSGANQDLEEVFRSTRTTPPPPVVPPTVEDPEYRRPVGSYGSVVYEPERTGLLPRPSVTYDRDRGKGSWSHRPGSGLGVGGNGRINFPRGETGRGSSGLDRLRNGARYPEEGDGGHRDGGRRVTLKTPHHGSTSVGNMGNRRNQNGGWSTRNGRYNPDQGGGYLTPRGSGAREPTNHRGTPITVDHDRSGLGGTVGGGRGREDWKGGRRQPSWPRGTGDRPGHFPSAFGETDLEAVTRGPSHYQPVTPTPPPRPSLAPIISTTTTTPSTTTIPKRHCQLKDRDYRDVMVPEGSTRRLYQGEKDCSVLCKCSPASATDRLETSCTAQLCTSNKACNTTRAQYPHTAPYVEAHRGDCVCYAGKFICQKPEPEMYSLGTGIYLFLGYSRVEVDLLKPHTSMTELEALEVLKEVLSRDYHFKCNLSIKKHIGENFIMVASLIVNPDTYIAPFMRQRKEKEECAGPLQEMVHKINTRPRHTDILTDAILSIFILAKVDVNFPEAQTSPSPAAPTPAQPLLLPLVVALSAHLLAHWAVQCPLRAT